MLLRQHCYVDGAWIGADGGGTIDVTNPATGEQIGTVPNAGAAETRRAIEAASRAFPAWAAKTAKERAGILRRCLARAYLNGSVYSGTKHDLREPKADHLVRKVRETESDAVIFLSAKFCEPALFDYALYRNALHAAAIPHLFLEFEEKMWVFDRMRSEVETFVESMLFD